jgi:hypothetical protein
MLAQIHQSSQKRRWTAASIEDAVSPDGWLPKHLYQRRLTVGSEFAPETASTLDLAQWVQP